MAGDDDHGSADEPAHMAPARVFRVTAIGTTSVLLVLLAAYGVYVVRGILLLVVIALFLAVSLDPIVRWLIHRGMPRSSAVALVFILLIALAAAFIWSVVPPIVDQGTRLIHDLPTYVNQLSEQSKAVRVVTDRYHLTDRLTSVMADLPAKLAGGTFGFFKQFVGALASTVTVLVLTIYFMADMPRMRGRIVRLFPRSRRQRAGDIVDVMVEKVGGYMIGNIIISVFAGGSAFLCLELLRVPFALPLAVTVAIADLIPMIGATLGAAVCVLASLVTVGLWPKTVILVLFFVLYQQVENYLLVPRVYRNTVNMPSFAVLLVALVGGTLFGLAGAIMAIPIAATVKVAVSPNVATREQPQPAAEPAARKDDLDRETPAPQPS